MTNSSNLGVSAYFGAVLALSAPFWILGAFSSWGPFPGVPLSALMVVVPGMVAFWFVARDTGYTAAAQWLRDALRLNALRRVGWVLVAGLLPPATLLVAYIAMLLGGQSMPDPQVDAIDIAVLLAIFLVPAVFEELGWCNFALVRLQRRMSALNASLVIGVVWIVWHLIPLLQVGRSLAWIGWWCAGTLALRVLITWVFNNAAGSALIAALCHASVNVSWQLFPVRGSHYDPAIHAPITVAVAILVVVAFRAQLLARAGQNPAN